MTITQTIDKQFKSIQSTSARRRLDKTDLIKIARFFVVILGGQGIVALADVFGYKIDSSGQILITVLLESLRRWYESAETVTTTITNATESMTEIPTSNQQQNPSGI